MFYLHLLRDEQMLKLFKGEIGTISLYYKGSVKAQC